MNSKLCCNPARPRRKTNKRDAVGVLASLAVLLVCLVAPPVGAAANADAPAWMHALVSVPLPAHDEKTDAVLLYSEDILNVQPNGKIKSVARRAYKILRL